MLYHFKCGIIVVIMAACRYKRIQYKKLVIYLWISLLPFIYKLKAPEEKYHVRIYVNTHMYISSNSFLLCSYNHALMYKMTVYMCIPRQ